MWGLVLIATLGQLDTPAYRRQLPAGESIATAADVVESCAADVIFNEPKYGRYITVPEWFDADYAFASVSQVLNSTISRTSNIVQPERVTDRLIRIDLDKYAVRDEDLAEIVKLWELLAAKDNYFHIPAKTSAAIGAEVKLTDGTWKPCTIQKGGDQNGNRTIVYGGKTLTVSAKDVRGGGDQLADIEGLDDLAKTLGTNVPVIRFEEFIANAFSSVNGGLYYQFTGISGDLHGTVERFAGKDAADKLITALGDVRRGRLDPALSQSRALVITSAVTGRQRLVQVFFGSNGQPSVGPQVIAITLDVAEDNTDPNSDPLRNLRDFRAYDGGEAIFTLANGMLAYVVFDAKDQIIESVPDKVAADHAARGIRANVATTRVFSGASCANCHESNVRNLGWQPVTNDALALVRLLSPLDDKSTNDRRRAVQELASQYGARDLESVFNLSRLPYQKQTHLATGLRTSKAVTGGIADTYWGYHYDRITPVEAARDLGHNLNAADSQALLLRIPPGIGVDEIREDAVLARLKDGQHVTPIQWRSVVSLVRERAEALEVAK